MCVSLAAAGPAPTLAALAEADGVVVTGPTGAAVIAGSPELASLPFPSGSAVYLVTADGVHATWTPDAFAAAWGPGAMADLAVAWSVAHGARPDKKELASRVTAACAGLATNPGSAAAGLRTWRARGGRGTPACAAEAAQHRAPAVRAAIASVLTPTQPDAQAILVALAADVDPVVQADAFVSLGPAAGPVAVAMLVDAASAETVVDPRVIPAAEAAVATGAPGVTDALVAVGERAGALEVFAAAVDGLAILGDNTAHDRLVMSVLQKRGPPAALPRAMDLAGQSPEPAVVGALAQIAGDRSAAPDQRSRALIALRTRVTKELAQLAVLDGLTGSPRSAEREGLLVVGLTALAWIDAVEGQRAVLFAVDQRFTASWRDDPLLTRHLLDLLLRLAPDDPRVGTLRASGVFAAFGVDG
jgi:hypothetical protein